MKLSGTWHIYEMDEWDEEYCNMEVQAYLRLSASGSSEFQFGLVHGQIYLTTEDEDGEWIDFDWEGNAEMDEASGHGWTELVSKDEAEGEISFLGGDSSGFRARRAPKTKTTGSSKKRKSGK
ncbi:MAG: hypothetical protein U0Z53_11890 [Blastocatellia bacterium]